MPYSICYQIFKLIQIKRRKFTEKLILRDPTVFYAAGTAPKLASTLYQWLKIKVKCIQIGHYQMYVT